MKNLKNIIYLRNSFKGFVGINLSDKYKPFLKKQTPTNQMYYGIPVTKTIPKNKEDLISKFKYVTNYDDLIDVLETSSSQFDGETMAKFLERLYW